MNFLFRQPIYKTLLPAKEGSGVSMIDYMQGVRINTWLFVLKYLKSTGRVHPL